MLTGGGPYAGSAEELTPLRLDWISAVPLAMIAMVLLAAPAAVFALARGGWGAHLLDVGSMRVIESEEFWSSSLSRSGMVWRQPGALCQGDAVCRMSGLRDRRTGSRVAASLGASPDVKMTE